MDLHQLEIKLFADSDATFAASKYIAIFHRWIQQRRLVDELLIDVADYSHVPRGPGVMLVGHTAHYRIDFADGEMGLLYAAKRDPLGSAQSKLQDGFRKALSAAKLLLAEDSLAGSLSFRTDLAQVTVMSRVHAPNTDEGWAAFAPELTSFARRLFADTDVAVERVVGDGRGPLCARLVAVAPTDLGTLLDRAGGLAAPKKLLTML